MPKAPDHIPDRIRVSALFEQEVIEMRNEWICRGCEDGPDDILFEGVTRFNVLALDIPDVLYQPDSLAVAISAIVTCDRCGKVVRCYKRSTMLKEPEKAPEPVLEAESVEEEFTPLEEVKEPLQEEVPEETVAEEAVEPIEAEVVVPEPDPEAEAKKAEIAALKAQIEALEAE